MFPRHLLPWISWNLLTALLLFAAAPADQLTRLRKATRLPTVHLDLDFGFNASEGIEAWDPVTDPAGEIKRLEQAMTGRTEDTERWLEIARLHAKLKAKQPAEEARNKAVALLRVRLQENPDDARSMAALGDALPAADNEEAEKLLRQSVARSPEDGWCHLKLGKYLTSQWLEAKGFGQTDGESAAFSRPAEPLEQEAVKHLNRAVELSPDDPAPLLQRALLGWCKGFLGGASENNSSDSPSNRAIGEHLQATMLPDFRAAERIVPEDYRVLAMRLWTEAATSRLIAGIPAEESLSEASRQEILDGLGKLRRLAEGAASEKRSAAIWEAKSLIEGFSLLDGTAAERSLDQCLRLDPDHPRAWNFKMRFLKDPKRYEDCVTFLEKTLQHTNTAKVRMYLAKSYFKAGKHDKAATQVAEALKLEPENLLARASDATLKLLKAETKEEFAEIREIIQAGMTSAQSLDRENKNNRYLYEHLWVTAVIHTALSESIASAKITMDRFRGRIPEGDYFKAVDAILFPGFAE